MCLLPDRISVMTLNVFRWNCLHTLTAGELWIQHSWNDHNYAWHEMLSFPLQTLQMQRNKTLGMDHEIHFYNVLQTLFNSTKISLLSSWRRIEFTHRCVVIVHGTYGFEEQLTHSKCLFISLIIEAVWSPWDGIVRQIWTFSMYIVWLSLSRKLSLFM